VYLAIGVVVRGSTIYLALGIVGEAVGTVGSQ
jgi:hypothetical protein